MHYKYLVLINISFLALFRFFLLLTWWFTVHCIKFFIGGTSKCAFDWADGAGVNVRLVDAVLIDCAACAHNILLLFWNHWLQLNLLGDHFSVKAGWCFCLKAMGCFRVDCFMGFLAAHQEEFLGLIRLICVAAPLSSDYPQPRGEFCHSYSLFWSYLVFVRRWFFRWALNHSFSNKFFCKLKW